LIAFVHHSVAHHCTFSTSAAVATGAVNTLGNKGAVAIYLRLGKTTFLVTNAHLAAHQNDEVRRNSDFNKINKILPTLLERKDIQFFDKRISKDSNSAVGSTSAVRTRIESAENGKRMSLPRKGSDLNNILNDKFRNGSTPPRIASASKQHDIQLGNDNYDTENIVDIDDDDDDDDAPSQSNTPKRKEMLLVLPKDSSSDLGSEVSNVEEIKISSARFLSFNNLSMNRLSTSAPVVNNIDGSGERTLDQCAEVVLFMGDLNYRIKGNRYVVL